MKKTVLLLWIAFLSISLFADPIDKNTALKVANNYYTIQLKKASPNFTLAYECSSQAWSVNKSTPVDKKTYYYVFNNADKGFIIISADDAVYPVLGYSDSGSFDINKQADNFTKWMEGYKQQIRYVIDNNIYATAEIKSEWNNILKGKYIAAKNTKTVAPLVQAKWSQGPYENADCPYDTDENKHAVTGCPATAMAQIMKYWEYPKQGKGFHSYNHDKYGTLSANFASTTYDWASMPNGTLNSDNPAVAELMYHCGVGVEMGYGAYSSGSYVILDYTTKPEACSEYAYKTYFDYEITIGGKMRKDYSDATWKQMLRTDLDAKQPIQYAGFGQGGHTFVCDGYNASDEFHFNWGWGGSHDGYFLIDALNPGSGGTGSGSGTYNDNQQAIFGLKPADGSNPGGGGGTITGFDLVLNDELTVTPSPISYGYSFSVHTDIINNGTATFNGDFCAALFDSEYDFVDFIYTKENYELPSTYHYTNGLSFSTDGMLSALPGDYYIGIFYKETDGDWVIIDKGDYSQLIPFKVENLDDIRLYSEMPNTTIVQNEAFDITIDIANYRETNFSGGFTVGIYNMDGSKAATVERHDDMTLDSRKYNDFTFSSTGVDIAPGTYLMALQYYNDGDEYWTLAGTGDFTNPIKVTVKAPGLVGDNYEDNNSENDPWDLPLTFTKTTSATALTTGSNMHHGEDMDYYKIDLPTGYNYTVNARTHDSYSSANGQTYTNDVGWMYFYDGVWSDTNDDVMSNSLTVTNGGSVIFSVSSYFVGGIGTYLLDIDVSNDGAYTSVEEIDFAENIKIYPIPAKDFITLDVRNFPAKVNKLNFISLSGRKINADFNSTDKLIKIPVNQLSEGVFILSIETENGIIQKKVLISK